MARGIAAEVVHGARLAEDLRAAEVREPHRIDRRQRRRPAFFGEQCAVEQIGRFEVGGPRGAGER